MRQSEHILYITLVDFLLQLVFLGLVIGVVYAVGSQGDTEELKQIKAQLGTSDLTKLTDELTRLAPLKDIESSVSSVGGVQIAKKILEEQAKKQEGQGQKSCLPNGAIVATFDAFENRIEVKRPLSLEFQKLLGELNIAAQLSPMSFELFTKTFSPILSRYPECRFNVIVVEHSYDTRPRDTVRKIFWVKGLKKIS